MGEETPWEMNPRTFIALLKMRVIEIKHDDVGARFAGRLVRLNDKFPENEVVEALYDMLKENL